MNCRKLFISECDEKMLSAIFFRLFKGMTFSAGFFSSKEAEMYGEKLKINNSLSELHGEVDIY